MVNQLWDTIKESLTAFTGLSPATFFTALTVGLAVYYLPPPIQVGEITEEELKQYDGSDTEKPLLMVIKG